MVIARELLRLKATLEEARDLAVLIAKAARGEPRASVSACAENVDAAIDCVNKARNVPEIQRMLDSHIEQIQQENTPQTR